MVKRHSPYAQQISDAYEKFSLEREALRKGIPTAPNSPGTGGRLIGIADPYPFYQDEINLEPINTRINLTSQLLMIEDSQSSPQVDAQTLPMLLEKLKSDGSLGSGTAHEITQRFFDWRQSPSKQTHHALSKILGETFPELYVHPLSRLKEQVARLLLSGIPCDPAPDSDTISITGGMGGGTSAGATVAILTALRKPEQSVILPVPSYFGFPLSIDTLFNTAPLLVDTQQTQFKLTAETLEEAINKQSGVKAGSWLIFTNPDSITMAEYTQDELQALARVIAKHQLNVLTDELYARVGTQEHCSLASLEAHGPDNYSLQDHVFTVTGNSKQINFFRPQIKFGVASGPESSMSAVVNGTDWDQLCMESPVEALWHTECLKIVSGEDRERYRETVTARYNDLAKSVKQLNERLGKEEVILNGNGGHLATLTLSKHLLDKVGIQNSEDLQRYLLYMTKIDTHQLGLMGVNTPIVRINVTQAYPQLDDMIERLGELVKQIEQGLAPPASGVCKVFDDLVERHTAEQSIEGQSR